MPRNELDHSLSTTYRKNLPLKSQNNTPQNY